MYLSDLIFNSEGAHAYAGLKSNIHEYTVTLKNTLAQEEGVIYIPVCVTIDGLQGGCRDLRLSSVSAGRTPECSW